jgi:tetratricopeptide (TPR) repeat protein
MRMRHSTAHAYNSPPCTRDRYVMKKVMMAFAARLKAQHVRASFYCRSVLLFRSPALVYKLRILHRLCSVSPPPVLCIPGLSRRPRPLPYILGGVLLSVLWDRDKEDTVPPYIKSQLLKAQRSLRDGDYTAASEAYHRALKRLATSQFAETQPYIEARAVVLDKLANMYLEQGLLTEAETTFKEAMKFMLRAGMDQESEAMVEMSLKLSKIYTNQNNHELADAGFSWCVATAEKLCSTSRTENNLALWGMCLHSKGQYHLSRGQWNPAILCLTEALQISLEVFTASHIQVRLRGREEDPLISKISPPSGHFAMMRIKLP